MSEKTKRRPHSIMRFNMWGYIFLVPFFVVFIIFQFIPLCSTIYYSFFEYYRAGLKEVGPNFVGLQNYIEIIKNGDLLYYFRNTMIMWVAGFIPQILVSLLLAAWFSDPSLHIKGKKFFQCVIYMPNLIMASAFAMLFFTLFAKTGPINSIYVDTLVWCSKHFPFLQPVFDFLHLQPEAVDFLANVHWTRGLVAFMNFLMWFGNTTILLLAGMLGIDTSLFEAAEVDGATATQIFFRISLPILRPILIYVVITSLIGGIQMYDVPQILTGNSGNPLVHGHLTSMTLIMFLNQNLYSKNYGLGGALSVYLFVITAILSLIVFRLNTKKDND